MADTTTRRPLPALIALLALLLLTGIVWWRVASRDDTTTPSADCTSSAPSRAQLAKQLPAPATVTVQVLNSTKKDGLGAGVRGVLQQRGFEVTPVGNTRPTLTGIGDIRFGPSGRKAATLLHYYFPTAAMKTTASKTAVVQVVLGKRYKTVATQSRVDTAIKGAKLTVSSPTPPALPDAGC